MDATIYPVNVQFCRLANSWWTTCGADREDFWPTNFIKIWPKKGTKKSLTSYIQRETVEADRYIPAMVYPHSATSQGRKKPLLWQCKTTCSLLISGGATTWADRATAGLRRCRFHYRRPPGFAVVVFITDSIYKNLSIIEKYY